MISKQVVLVIGLSIPLNTDLSIQNDYKSKPVLNEYKSPTLHQPYDSYSEKQYRELIEKIFIDRLKSEL